MAMSKNLHLTRQSRRNYPLKIISNSKNIPHGKKGNFVASSVKCFPENTKNSVLVIKKQQKY